MHDGGGNSVAASVTAQGVVFEASRPDVYTANGPSGEVWVVANVGDPRYAQINRSRFSGGATALQRDASARNWNAELWALLLLLAGAFLLFEWAVFTRPRAA